jgi:hypothetical protein
MKPLVILTDTVRERNMVQSIDSILNVRNSGVFPNSIMENTMVHVSARFIRKMDVRVIC